LEVFKSDLFLSAHRFANLLNERSNSPSLFLWQKYGRQKDTTANLTKPFLHRRDGNAAEMKSLVFSNFQSSVEFEVEDFSGLRWLRVVGVAFGLCLSNALAGTGCKPVPLSLARHGS
jgi:hypothetical protein